MTSVDATLPAQGQRKRLKLDIHGWIVLDKPIGMTSTHAVSFVVTQGSAIMYVIGRFGLRT